MSNSISTPTLDNQKLFTDTLNKYPKDLGKALLKTLLDREEVEWKGTYQVLGSQSTKQVAGKIRIAQPWKAVKTTSFKSAKTFFREANYTNVFGKEINSTIEVYAFMHKWYDVLKKTKQLATLGAGPIGLVFTTIELFDSLWTARKDLAQWYNSLGHEEHKREGTHLLKLNQFHTKLVSNIYQSIEESRSIPTAKERRAEHDQFHQKLEKFLPADQLKRATRAFRTQAIDRFDQRSRQIDEMYLAQLQGMMGLLLEAAMLGKTLDRIVADCDANPLRYWGCSFQKGYVNPGPGMVGELLKPGESTVSLTLLKPKVKNYKVVGALGTETKQYVEGVLAKIENEVRGKAIAMNNLLDIKHLPAFRARTIQLIEQLEWAHS